MPLHIPRQIHAFTCSGKLSVTIQVCIVGGSCKQCAAILGERGYNRCCALNRTGCNLVNHPLHGCKNNVLCTGIQAHRHVATDVFFVGARVKQHGCVAPYVPCIAERATQISSCNGSCLTFQKHPFAAVRGELFRPLCKVENLLALFGGQRLHTEFGCSIRLHVAFIVNAHAQQLQKLVVRGLARFAYPIPDSFQVRVRRFR